MGEGVLAGMGVGRGWGQGDLGCYWGVVIWGCLVVRGGGAGGCGGIGVWGVGGWVGGMRGRWR